MTMSRSRGDLSSMILKNVYSLTMCLSEVLNTVSYRSPTLEDQRVKTEGHIIWVSPLTLL